MTLIAMVLCDFLLVTQSQRKCFWLTAGLSEAYRLTKAT